MKSVLIIAVFLSNYFFAQFKPIILDDNFSDWNNQYLLYTDKQNDGDNNGLDFRSFYATNDDRYFYFFIEVGKEINLQSNNGLTLYIDTDFKKSTGYLINGIGADLIFSFGKRSGVYWSVTGEENNIKHIDIGLVTSPTVTSSRFEGKMNLDSKILGEKVFRGDSIRIILKDEPGGDVLPDSSGGVKYVMKKNIHFIPPAYSLKKVDSDYLRVMAYNVHKDDLFDQSRRGSFKNIFKAINPDIIGLEEVYNHSAQDAANLIASFLPLNNGEWYSAKTNSDVLAVSKFPILSSFAIDGNAAFLINLEKYGKKLLLIVAHPPCCDNDNARQEEIDHIMAFIRDAKDSSGVLKLPKDSPIIIEGDMNLVGKARQVKTLLEGDILNENTYGPDFSPDWDGTFLDDAKPVTTGLPTTFTWYSKGSSYPPGRLDYLIFSGSVMDLVNGFSLFTQALPADTLTAYSLQATDVSNSSDHLPIVADFNMQLKTEVAPQKKIKMNFKLLQNYPNPVGINSNSSITNIRYYLPLNFRTQFNTYSKGLQGGIVLKVFNLLGQTVYEAKNSNITPGMHSFKLDVSFLPAGVYFYSLIFENIRLTKKMIVIH